MQTMEGQYLKRSITVGCKQRQLQIGGLGWEESFIDCTLYQNYCILDSNSYGVDCALKIRGKAFSLPIKTDTIDLVILPHMLEFDKYRFETIREVSRVLRAGGEIIILGFNPYSLTVRYQSLLEKKFAASWKTHFISRSRILDWLELMNFEVLNTAEFYLDTFRITQGSHFAFSGRAFLAMAYGIRAVKREYRLIPVGRVAQEPSRLATAAAGLKSSAVIDS